MYVPLCLFVFVTHVFVCALTVLLHSSTEPPPPSASLESERKRTSDSKTLNCAWTAATGQVEELGVGLMVMDPAG